MSGGTDDLETDLRLPGKQHEIKAILEAYYPELKFLRDLFLFESFPVTIIFYIIVHLTFYFLLVTEHRPLSLVVFFLTVGYAGGKLAEHVVLPTYKTYRIREINKRGRNKVEFEEQQQYIERLSRRLSIIALFIEDCYLHLKVMHTENHSRFCALTMVFGLIVFLIGWFIPGVLISYSILLFILVWPIIVHNQLPRHLAGIHAGLEPFLNLIKKHALEGVKKIPHPSTTTGPTIAELSPQEINKAERQFLEQSIAITPSLNLHNPPDIMESIAPYSVKPQYIPQYTGTPSYNPQYKDTPPYGPYNPPYNPYYTDTPSYNQQYTAAPMDTGSFDVTAGIHPTRLDWTNGNKELSDYDVVDREEVTGYNQ